MIRCSHRCRRNAALNGCGSENDGAGGGAKVGSGGGANDEGGGGAEHDGVGGGANEGGGGALVNAESVPGRSKVLPPDGPRIAFRSLPAMSDRWVGACVKRSTAALMSRASPPTFPP